jgi:hypothetical protein
MALEVEANPVGKEKARLASISEHVACFAQRATALVTTKGQATMMERKIQLLHAVSPQKLAYSLCNLAMVMGGDGE